MFRDRIPCFSALIDERRRRVSVGAVGVLTFLTVLISVVAQADDFGVSRRRGTTPLQSSSQSNPSNSALSSLPDIPAVPAESAPKTGSPFALPFTNPLVPKVPAGSSLENTLPNVVRIVAFDKDGQSFGSGSYIGVHEDYGVILSNWHVVADGNGLVHVHFPGGFSSFGAIVRSDDKWDLAAIVISRPPAGIPALPITKTVPKPGEPLWIAGHGSGSYRLAGGRCVRYLAPEVPPDGTPPLYEIIELSVSARQGDSGGPILNRNGELAGVLFGSDMIRNTAGSHCERANRFLVQANPFLEKLPKRPEVYFASVEPDGPRHQLSETLHAAGPEKATPHGLVAAPVSRRGVDLGGSSFGVRSPSRRYTQNTPNPPAPPTPEQTPKSPASSTTTSVAPAKDPLPSPTAPVQAPPTSLRTKDSQSIQPATWTNPVSRSRSAPPETSPAIPRPKSVASKAPVPEKTRNEGNIPDPFDNGLVSLNPDPNRSREVDSDFSIPSARLAEAESKYGQRRGLATVSERNESLPPILIGVGLLAVALLVYLSIRLLQSESAELSQSVNADPARRSVSAPTKNREANAA